jgi:2-polyprenyl-3-methyl-5-hydroxy-6-metoxy-1,4-benzoquinol methylase
MTDTCPVCGSLRLESAYPEYRGACITSDMMVMPASSLQNRMCSDCGLIFNAGGPRGATEAFYRDSYSLMLHSAEGAIQSFAGPQPMSQAERSFHILRELAELPKQGHVVEAGAGKGEFMGYFAAGLPEWKVSAFEPSEAFATLKDKFPAARLERCDYHAFASTGETYDLIVALGVLEHVESPLSMLRWGHSLLAEGGVFFIRVPHFPRNPNDLFCADHLSKLTEPTLRSLAANAGFEVIGHKEAGVPIFMALRKGTATKAEEGAAAEVNRKVLHQNVGVARSMMEAILRGREEAARKNERFAIFGLGSAGLFAPLFASFPASDITAYLDENRSMWGGQIHGRPIGGLDLIEREGIRHVALAISPVYVEQVSAKLRPLGVTIYSA